MRSPVVLFANNLLSGGLNVRFLSIPNANVRIVAESTQLRSNLVGKLVRAIVVREVPARPQLLELTRDTITDIREDIPLRDFRLDFFEQLKFLIGVHLQRVITVIRRV